MIQIASCERAFEQSFWYTNQAIQKPKPIYNNSNFLFDSSSTDKMYQQKNIKI